MLEEYDAEGDFVELRAHYENLLQSHRSIEKARIQLELLEPIVEDGKAFQEQEKEVKQLEELTENIAPFFAEKRIALLEEMNVSLTTDLDKKGAQINEIKYEVNQLGTQHTELRIALNSNQGYERIKNIEQQISQLELEKDQRQQKAKGYASLAKKLDLKDTPNERTFYKNLENSRKEITRLEEEKQQLLKIQTPQASYAMWEEIEDFELDGLANLLENITVTKAFFLKDYLEQLLEKILQQKELIATNGSRRTSRKWKPIGYGCLKILLGYQLIMSDLPMQKIFFHINYALISHSLLR